VRGSTQTLRVCDSGQLYILGQNVKPRDVAYDLTKI